jgi:hypothetical protein
MNSCLPFFHIAPFFLDWGLENNGPWANSPIICFHKQGFIGTQLISLFFCFVFTYCLWLLSKNRSKYRDSLALYRKSFPMSVPSIYTFCVVLMKAYAQFMSCLVHLKFYTRHILHKTHLENEYEIVWIFVMVNLAC